MNKRERSLSIILISVILLFAGGFIGYQLVLSPWRQNTKTMETLRAELDDLETKKAEIERQQYVFETKTKAKSLPADVTLAQREYERMLDRMLRKADFVSTPIITPRPPTNQNVALVASKKPAYTKLDFEVQVKGDVLALVDFMHNFYRQPLLHQIRKINIVKPSTSLSGKRDLDMTFSIEALVLDVAENRPTLLADFPFMAIATGGALTTGMNIRNVESGNGSFFTAGGVLARDNSSFAKTSTNNEYRRIAGKDIFFGPTPTVIKQETHEAVLDPFLFLTRVSHSNGTSRAMIHDRWNNNEYEIETGSGGVITVSKYWFLTRRDENGLTTVLRKKVSPDDYDSRFLEFGQEGQENYRVYLVRRILENELLLESYNEPRVKLMKGPVTGLLGGTANLALPGKYYLWRNGQFLASEEKNLSMRELKSKKDIRTALLRPLNIDNEPAEQSRALNDEAKPGR